MGTERGDGERAATDARARVEALVRELDGGGAAVQGVFLRALVIGGAMMAGGVVVGVILEPVMGVTFGAFGAFVVATVSTQRSSARRNAVIAAAGAELERGHHDVASGLLDVVDAREPRAGASAATAYVRARIALARGDTSGARATLDAAARARGPRFSLSDIHAAQLVQCRALRAFAAALEGDHESARRDVVFVEEAVRERRFGRAVVVSETWVQVALAHVALAEALALSAGGGGAALAAHLAAHERVLREGTVPRERALYRGLVRLSRAEKRSAYRERPRAEQAAAESPEAWVDRLAPHVGAFLDRERPSVVAQPAAAAAPRAAVTAPVRPGAKGLARSHKVLLLWILIATFFFAIWQLLDADTAANVGPRPAPRVETPPWTPLALPMLVALPVAVVAIALVLALALWRADRRSRVVNETMCRLAVGLPIDEGTMTAWKGFGVDGFAMMRNAALSRTALAESRFDAALVHADQAFADVARAQGKLQGELLGMMSAARADALAALGRSAEARGEVATWPSDFSRRASAAVGVELVASLRDGDEESAHEIARRVNDEMSLDTRTEALVDLLRAKRGAIGLVDRARLREDVRAPMLRRFLMAIAPALVADLEREASADGSTDESVEQGSAEGADVEALAAVEHEAEGESIRGARASARR